MRIRDFKKGDETALWNVFYAAIHVTASANYSPEQLDAWAPRQVDPTRWAQRMQGIAPFVAEDDNGSIVAYADLQNSGYIDHFFVSPAVGRRGVGSLLMERIHEKAFSIGLSALFSEVSLSAQPFFEKWGFATEELKSVSIRGISLKNCRMRKML